MSFKDELEKILQSCVNTIGVAPHLLYHSDEEKQALIDNAIPNAITSIINLVDKELENARKEEWAKIHTKYQKGSVKGQYIILEAVRRVGKNTKFRVECQDCHGVMFRYANKFSLPHKNCVNKDMRAKLKGVSK